MDMVTRTPELFSDEFVQSRLASAVRYRQGDSDGVVLLVGAVGAALERAGAAVRRWARANGETDTLPHGMMRVR